jgi:hypothetical protein
MRLVGLCVAVVATAMVGSATSVADAAEPAAQTAVGHAGFDSTTGWGDPQLIDSGGLVSVSCTSPMFCAAVDFTGHALTYDGDGWSAGRLIDAKPYTEAVSCASAAFCVAVDIHGKVWVYGHSGWSPPTKEAPHMLWGVSCTSHTFCVAVGTIPSRAYTYTGSTWKHTDLPADASGVSCVSESMCVAVGDRNAITFDGNQWVADEIVPSRPTGVGLASVSCVTEQFCVAVDGIGRAYTYDGTGWTKPTVVVPMKRKFGGASVSCGAVGMCVMVAANGLAAMLTGDGWSSPQRIDPVEYNRAVSVSCSGPKFCTAVHAGYATVYQP